MVDFLRGECIFGPKKHIYHLEIRMSIMAAHFKSLDMMIAAKRICSINQTSVRALNMINLILGP